ncbi:hypothetical protein B484DRAFT_457692 [Ochromonadaceae sp. CCMP2298]|nr:hypothetical protein B484DRAFT_457692 [Ochromonadaceae sp. CCMP2298]
MEFADGLARSVDDFAGVWLRTELQEPLGVLGPSWEQHPHRVVLWVQARSSPSAGALFADIRCPADQSPMYPPPSAPQTAELAQLQLLKSFAGVTTFDSDEAQIEWRREVDFRLPGSPDVGTVHFLPCPELPGGLLQEDGVLPGDDYREIWRRISLPEVTDCSVRLRCGETGAGAGARAGAGEVGADSVGFVLLVGDWFIVTLSRLQTDEALLDSLRLVFEQQQEGSEAQEQQEGMEGQQGQLAAALSHLRQCPYLAAAGHIIDWRIKHSVQPALIGCSLVQSETDGRESEESGLRALLRECVWEVVDGHVPEALSPYLV